MTEYTKIFLGNILSWTKNREKFTDDAMLYQEILSFSLRGIEYQSFTRWKMCKWLKENHRPFENRSVESLQQMVARKISNLESKLIVEIGSQPVSKGKGQTSVYAFNSTGYFLGWLIESLSSDPTRMNKAIRSNVFPKESTKSTYRLLGLGLVAD
jgi:hypothetical protein